MNKSNKKDGFTLVEIALALLVVAIGVVSIMGLFPAGLQANQRSIDETRVAMFAEDVLGGVKTIIEETPWEDVQSYLQIQGLPMVGSPDMFAPANILASNPDPDIQYRYADSGYKNVDAGVPVVEFELRYELDVTGVPPVSPTVYAITLQVWPNKHSPEEDGLVFYTEAYYHGRHN
jgi:prepilin-type N-terminal cleavage/methylation domain-containing protein